MGADAGAGIPSGDRPPSPIDDRAPREAAARGPRPSAAHPTQGTALALWDIDSWETIARRTIQLARDVGALRALPGALHAWVWGLVATGELPAAATALAEAEAISDATGGTSPEDKDHSAWLDAWRFDEPEALRRIDTVERPSMRLAPPHLEHARAVVYNAAGRYEAALAAAQRSCDLHPTGTHSWALVDLVEAAVRCDQHERAARRARPTQGADSTRVDGVESWPGGPLRGPRHRRRCCRRRALRRSRRAPRPCADSS